ncbi:MAG TPA: succinyl-CoA--3-ketoacid-CoA transferase, partial [Dehalococcoidia bacterium]|nr:succinyl-CoA--3-ketoacid-CoA transferase [Dehalococcoidia bacterium]
MKEKVFTNFDKIIADIPNGSVIMISGFAGPGTPRNLINALAKTTIKDLTIVCNTPGRWGDSRMDAGALILNGQV